MAVSLKSYGADAPFKAPLVNKDNTVNLTWLAWFGRVIAAMKILVASTDYNPPAIGAGGVSTTSVTVTGASLGDFATASFSAPNSGVLLLAQVTAENTVSVAFWNVTGSAIDLAAGTLRVRVEVNA
jgi:hypothetical protein